MKPVIPFWMKQRQIQAEPADSQGLRLTGLNLDPHVITVSSNDQGWTCTITREEMNGQPGTVIAKSEEPYPDPQTAWDAAFELYRREVIV